MLFAVSSEAESAILTYPLQPFKGYYRTGASSLIVSLNTVLPRYLKSTAYLPSFCEVRGLFII